MLCMDLVTNSGCRLSQHQMVFIIDTESVYCAVRTGSLNVIQVICSL